MTTKERIDKLLVAGGLAESRTKANALVMAGVVLVNEQRVAKPSEVFAPDAVIRIKGDSPENKYVGRGGLKLEAALEAFPIDPAGLVCIDIGSSTGGFTDCLLKKSATSVVAIDVGTNQLVWSLRNDPRVEVRENTNARELTPGDFDALFDLAVMDVSFISVTKILPAVFDILKPDGKIVVLIKPQFEVGRGEVGKGGIVRETEKHERVVREVTDFAAGMGFSSEGLIESPILGAEGNKEFLALYAKRSEPGAIATGFPVPGEKNPVAIAPGSDLVDGKETLNQIFVEGLDFYFEDQLMVLTARYLRNRGYCCGNDCRHCPYEGEDKKRSQ